MVPIFFLIASSSHPLLTEHFSKSSGRSAVEVNIENERFTVMIVLTLSLKP